MLKGNIIPTIAAVLTLILVVVDIVVALGNQTLQTEANERQQFITQSIQLEALNRQVINVLANMAVKTNDEQLKSLLASSGVNLGPNPEPAGGSK